MKPGLVLPLSFLTAYAGAGNSGLTDDLSAVMDGILLEPGAEANHISFYVILAGLLSQQ